MQVSQSGCLATVLTFFYLKPLNSGPLHAFSINFQEVMDGINPFKGDYQIGSSSQEVIPRRVLFLDFRQSQAGRGIFVHGQWNAF